MTDIKYAGKSFLKDLGVYVDSIQSYGTPRKDYTFHEVLGRNGSLAVDNHRFDDHEETFNCYIKEDFVPKYRAVTAFLNAVKGYQRLERANEQDYFEKAIFEGSIGPAPTQLLKAGSFPLRFRMHPEKWLKSGEIAVDASSNPTTLSGNPVQIDNPSGLTTITDLQTSFSPKQDLNGYDHPWVGGAGKNLFNKNGSLENNKFIQASGALVSSPNWNTTDYQQITPNTYTMSGATEGAGGYYGICWYDSEKTYISGFQRFATSPQTVTIPSNAQYVRYSVNNSALDTFMLEQGSVATSYEPYENICPISGHTQAVVSRTGKNLIDLAGTFTSVQYSSPVSLPAGEYYVYVFNSIDKGSYNSFFQYFDGTGFANFSTTSNEYGYVDQQMSYNVKKCKVTLNKACTVRQMLQVNSATSGATFAVMLTKDGSNYASVPKQPPYSRLSELYEPYSGNTYTIDLNGTVYGGTLDVLTGVLTVNKKLFTFDGTQAVGLANWRPFSGSSAWLYRIAITADMRQPVDPNINILCDKLKPIPYSELYGGIYANNIGIACAGGTVWGIAMRVPVEGLTTAAQINAWLAENPVTVCYELEEPTTVQLTAQQVSLLTGVNYISTDGDTVTVTITEPSVLENPTLFESKPMVRIYGTGTVNINNDYITIAESSPFSYIDIDCETMNASSDGSNANQYVTINTEGLLTLQPGTNYIAHSGSVTKVEVTPRWYTV